jgi:hypothetical protein
MKSWPPSLHLREKGGSAPQGEAPAIRGEAAAKAEREITCVRCGGGITQEKARIAINGAHVHTFKNPSSIDYTIGCFRDAHGCLGIGERSMVWTWFPGFAWQAALCARCGAHLGWTFEGDAARFWGLILERLRD